jgi:hypothetical protein
MPRSDKKTLTYSSVTKPQQFNIPQYKPPTIGQSIKEGFGFGLGSRIAQNLFSPYSSPYSTPYSSPYSDNTKKRDIECEKVKKDFEQCKTNENCSLEVLSYFRKQYDSCFEK